MFGIPVQVHNRSITVVVDTAAEVTLLSDRVYNGLINQPSKIRDVRLCIAGKQLTMKEFVACPFDIIIKAISIRRKCMSFQFMMICFLV